jgi:hypothetical protein
MFKSANFDENGYLYLGAENYSYKFEEKNGPFFEKMVTTEVCRINSEAMEKVKEIWVNVKTRKFAGDANDAEHDVVIVTKFGTLILIEIKSSKFETSIAKGQERDVYQKSGNYGLSFIATPLLKEMWDYYSKAQDKQEAERHYEYVASFYFKHAKKVKDAGIQYWCFDEITEKLGETLSPKKS